MPSLDPSRDSFQIEKHLHFLLYELYKHAINTYFFDAYTLLIFNIVLKQYSNYIALAIVPLLALAVDPFVGCMEICRYHQRLKEYVKAEGLHPRA